jgi:3-oxoacyl-[acyl-carrier-protein] synthase II
VNRVVVTGCGVVSPLGNDVETLLEALLAGRSGVVRMDSWTDYRGLRSLVAAPVPEVDERAIPRRHRRTMGRLALFGTLAADQAVRDAGLAPGDAALREGGCVIGSTMGSAGAINEAFETMLPAKDLSMMSGTQFFKCVSHTAAMNVSQYLGIGGTVLAPSAACASGLQALGVAADLIRCGRHHVVVCGGAEEVHPTVTGSFDVLFATSTRYESQPGRTPRPFDAARDGLVCGEGAGIFVLESLDHAARRGARVRAELLGHATCANAVHVSQSDRPSVLRCMSAALRDAGLGPDDVDHVSAHATGTQQGDAEEAAALRDLVGDKVPVSSLKGHIGHTLGASGPIEMAATLAAAERGIVLPTRNLDDVDPACAGLWHVREVLDRRTRIFLKNSFAFGGINAALVCRAV